MNSKQILAELIRRDIYESEPARAIFTNKTMGSIHSYQKYYTDTLTAPKEGFTGTLAFDRDQLCFYPDEPGAYIMRIHRAYVNTLHIPSLRHYIY
jgi:hypothetical protein